jgi:hypothetical protein
MIQISSIEERIMKLPGKPAVTIIRTVDLKNGKGRKTLKVLKGPTVVSTESEPLNLTERKKVHKRKFVKGLYKKMERRTLRRLRDL